jgi:hypothetical protein
LTLQADVALAATDVLKQHVRSKTSLPPTLQLLKRNINSTSYVRAKDKQLLYSRIRFSNLQHQCTVQGISCSSGGLLVLLVAVCSLQIAAAAVLAQQSRTHQAQWANLHRAMLNSSCHAQVNEYPTLG